MNQCFILFPLLRTPTKAQKNLNQGSVPKYDLNSIYSACLQGDSPNFLTLASPQR